MSNFYINSHSALKIYLCVHYIKLHMHLPLQKDLISPQSSTVIAGSFQSHS